MRTNDIVLKAAGATLIGCSLSFGAVFAFLARTFGYPDVLSHDAAAVLPALAAGGTRLRIVWFIYAALPLGIIFAAAASGQLLERGGRTLRATGMAAGCTAGIAMIVGLLRWPTLEWTLAAYWQAAAAPARPALAALFDGSNLLLGNVVGEFVGEMGVALWFGALGLSFRADGRRRLGNLGIAAGILVVVAALRNMTSAVAVVAEINNVTLPLWTITLGIVFLRVGSGGAVDRGERGPEAVTVSVGRGERAAGVETRGAFPPSSA